MKTFEFRGMVIPERMMIPLQEYTENHQPVGGFLEAVISNNLFAACTKADESNLHLLPAYIAYLYNYAPSGCWGSAEKYQEWIKGEKNV